MLKQAGQPSFSTSTQRGARGIRRCDGEEATHSACDTPSLSTNAHSSPQLFGLISRNPPPLSAQHIPSQHRAAPLSGLSFLKARDSFGVKRCSGSGAAHSSSGCSCISAKRWAQLRMQNIDVVSEFPNKKREKKEVSYPLFLYSQCKNIPRRVRRHLPSLRKVHIPTSAGGREEEQGTREGGTGTRGSWSHKTILCKIWKCGRNAGRLKTRMFINI